MVAQERVMPAPLTAREPSASAARTDTTSIVWITSYPKSGNTWVRIFFSNLLQPDTRAAVSINDLPLRLHAASRTLFDELIGIDSSDLREEEAAALRPLLYRQLAATLAPPIVIKTHDSYQLTPDDAPLFPGDVTRAAIYVVRNPLDVAVSYAHHDALPLDTIVERMANPEFAVAGTGRLHLRQRLGSWSGHVQSWLTAPLPLELVRYEDLRTDPLMHFARLLRRAGVSASADRLPWAIEASSFERLRAQELSSGFAETPVSAGTFFRSGHAGGWRTVLTRAQVDRIVRDHGALMLRFGYLSPAGAPL